MPYTNIIYIKLFLELFDGDDRFLCGLTERQQLLYLKLLYLAGRQGNKITKNLQFMRQKLNYESSEELLKLDLERIKIIFPKFKEREEYYTFFNFCTLHNFIKKGNSEGTPKELQRILPEKRREDKIRVDKNRDPETLALSELLRDLIIKNNPKAIIKPSQILKWSEVVRLMNGQDKISFADIKTAIEKSQADKETRGDWKGWSAVILSMHNVRKHYNKLIVLTPGGSNDPRVGAAAPVKGKYAHLK